MNGGESSRLDNHLKIVLLLATIASLLATVASMLIMLPILALAIWRLS